MNPPHAAPEGTLTYVRRCEFEGRERGLPAQFVNESNENNNKNLFSWRIF
jgi:hypothetical protein